MNNSLFGPLGKQYCLIWYLLCIVCIVSIVINVFALIFMVYNKEKNFSSYFLIIYVSIFAGVGYIQNRLLYQMCNTVI
jgi:hypothetical protein